MTHAEEIKDLLDHPEKLLQKRPFTRGAEFEPDGTDDAPIYRNNEVQARLPRYKRLIVPQEQFLQELDPNCHRAIPHSMLICLILMVKHIPGIITQVLSQQLIISV